MRKSILFNLIWAALLSIACTVVSAQSRQYHFTSITSKDGLSSNTVNTILKDRYGFIWFGTEDGLTKFDGLQYKVYRHHPQDSTSLSSSEVTCLYEDNAGRLWVGTSNALHLYDRKHNHFITYKAGNNKYGLTSPIIKSIGGDYLGNIWVATHEGLNRLNPVTGLVTRFRDLPNVPDAIGRQPVLSVFEDSHKRLWIGAKNGLYRYERRNGHFIPYLPDENEPQSLAGGNIKAIAEDATGQLWVGTTSGLSQLLPDGIHFKKITAQSKAGQNLSNNTIYALGTAGKGALWIGSEDGLNILNIRTGNIEHYLPDGRDSYSISGKSVRCILIDKQGISWIGTYVAGVNKYDRNLTLFNLKNSNPYDVYGLSSRFVTSFAPGDAGQIYVGTDGGGLNLFNPQNGLFKHIAIRAKQHNGTTGLGILALTRAHDGNLWMGTFQDGLFSYNPASGNVQQYLANGSTSSVNQNEIFCLEQDRAGRLWIGTNGGGVNVYDPKTSTFQFYVANPSSKQEQSLPINNYIRDFQEDQYGRMWIASHGSGIAIYDPATKQFSLLNNMDGNTAANKVNVLYLDRLGNMWAGSSDGLLKIDVNTKKVKVFGEAQGLADGDIHTIMEDDAGRIWFSTNQGVSWLDPKHLTVKNYNINNGLQSGSFEQGAGYRDAQGTLYFGGNDGFNYIQPRNIRHNLNPTPIMFTDLKIGTRSVTSTDSDVLSDDISVARKIKLNYKQNFSISFIGLNFTSSSQNQYYYRLKGFDHEWVFAGEKTTAYYTNLSPGTYTFQVKGKNSDGVWSKNEKSITVIISPPFWMTVYAYIFYLAAIGGFLLYLRYRGIQKLKKEFKEAEAQREAERLRDLDRLKIKFLTNLSHDFRTPIALIMAPVEKLLSQKPEEGTLTQLLMVKRNARRLLNIVNQLFDFRTIEERELKLNLVQDDVVAFLREVSESFQDLSEKKRIAFVFRSAVECLTVQFDPDKLERILFNLLSNAFKFTPEGGQVTMTAYLKSMQAGVDANLLCIEVSDTGIGMEKDHQVHVFDRFYQSRPSDKIFNLGSGIGLSIVKEFVELHGGTIELNSEPSVGSTFRVLLPIVVQEPMQPVPVQPPIAQQTEPILPEAQAMLIAQSKSQATVAIDDNETAMRPTILVVEDNEDFRYQLKHSLAAHYKVIEAADGKEGWQKALGAHPDLIVSDVMMPHMDGIELSMKLKGDKRTSHIPIILLTASSREEQQISGLSTGANDYLTKPFSFEILHIKIKNLLAFNLALKTTYTRQIKIKPNEIKVESAQEKFMMAVVTYIEDNLNNTQLSVEDLSRHIGMSRGSLYNKLLEITGLSPVEFIRSIKLEKAAALLEKSDMNIAQIAYAAGFATPNYFAKSFKSKYQMLPSEYLNKKRKPACQQVDK